NLAFNRLDISEVCAFSPRTNLRSIAVMQRLNMKDSFQNFFHPTIAAGHPLSKHVLYRINKDRWLALL
ncbi:MAG: GNAT family N-acetyltransferase, partial [Mariprofundus sp.]|nr:GNAT family N-acetyltransferase [Mariprofundus sp.]